MPQTHPDALRGLITLGQIDASDILLIQFHGKLPVPEEQQSKYHQLHGPVRITWQEMDPSLSGGYIHEHVSSELIEIDSHLNEGSDAALAMTIGQAMIRSLLERTAILVPDECAPRNPLQKYFGFEMDAALSMGENPEQRQNREMEMRDWQGGSGQYLNKTEILVRLHNIMVARASEAGRIPETRTELYAALAAEGFVPTASIQEMLSETLHGQAAVKVFGEARESISKNNFDSMVVELSKVLARFSTEQQEKIWNDVLPAYYGDLLTLYGHVNGRGAMKIGLNS